MQKKTEMFYPVSTAQIIVYGKTGILLANQFLVSLYVPLSTTKSLPGAEMSFSDGIKPLSLKTAIDSLKEE